MDKVDFDRADRLILGQVGVEKRFEVLPGFTGEDVESTSEAVFDGVLRGAGLAFG